MAGVPGSSPPLQPLQGNWGRPRAWKAPGNGNLAAEGCPQGAPVVWGPDWARHFNHSELSFLSYHPPPPAGGQD